MPNQGHFEQGYWLFIRKIQSASPVPCEEHPDFFYPEDYPEAKLRAVVTAYAKRLCKTCPVQKDCFTYAVESGQKHGIWGGTSPNER
jgi:hypothetical protein